MKNAVSAKLNLSGLRIFFIWFLTIIFPALICIKSLDFYIEKHFEYAKIQAVADASKKMDLFNHFLLSENYLQETIPSIRTFISDSDKPGAVVEKIAAELGSRPIMSIFQERKTRKLTSVIHRPIDLLQKTFPPSVLFKNLFKEMESGSKENPAELERISSSNKLNFQQLFKTLTTCTLIKNKVSRNFSCYFGGEIFFMLVETPESRNFTRALLVYRGLDLSPEIIIKNAQKKVPNTSIVLRRLNYCDNDNPQKSLNSGVYFSKHSISILKPANQNFIRHYLHNGGLRLVRDPQKIPFIKHSISFANIYSPLKGMRKSIVFTTMLLIVLMSAFFLRIGLLGFDFSSSLKNRVLAAIMISAMFPFAIFAGSIYWYSIFDQYLTRLNLIQHIEIAIAQNFERLLQKITELETYIISRPDLTSKLAFINESEFKKLAGKLGKILPFSEASYITEHRTFSYTIPARKASLTIGADDPIWSFIPSKTIHLLKEDGKKNRTPQYYFMIAGQMVKALVINDYIQSIGEFFMINQGSVPFWTSSTKIYNYNKIPAEPLAILTFKYDLGPILKSFYTENGKTNSLFSEKVGNYQVRYGYFPLKKAKNNEFWMGSYKKEDFNYFSDLQNMNLSQTFTRKVNGNEQIVLIRTNTGFPHKVIAVAQLDQQSIFLTWQQILVAGILFMGLIIIFSSQLLEYFFVHPIGLMAQNAERIARGGEDWELEILSGDELEELNNCFREMVKGLKQRNVLKNYVSEDAFTEIEETLNQELFPGGEYQEVSVIFATIKDTEKSSESLPAENIIATMDTFVRDCDLVCKKYFGTIDKVVENTVMLVFRNISGTMQHHSIRAATAAVELRSIQEQKNKTLQAGIASGKVISGRIGSYTGKLDFTVIGDTVNLAARLKNEAYDSRTGIIVSGLTMRMLKGKARVNFLRRCSIKGKSREFNIYELNELRV
ncbi:MAG: hypothetical protein Kow0029_17040 [Candidatus Rifleibacteriota bacterium]